MNRIPTNSTAMRNMLLLNIFSKQQKPRIAVSSNAGKLNQTEKATDKKNINPDKYDPHNNKYGYAWIDDVTFKRDSTGPLTELEKTLLHEMRTNLMLRQKALDAGCYGGKGGRADPYEMGMVDKDGYPISGAAHIANRMVANREQVNTDMADVLKSNGVTLTDKDSFSITVNFDSTITISGHADEMRGKEIERILNEAGYGRSLVGHIWESGNVYQPFSQCTYTEYQKYYTNHNIADYTGYSIYQLTVRDDGIYTDDGKDIGKLLHEAISARHPEPPEYAGQFTNSILRSIRQLSSSGGIANIREASFTIDYRNNSLCDVGASLGFGTDQRDWYDKLHSLRGDIGQLTAYAISIGVWTGDSASASSNLDMNA